jgi:FAD/FMN-containing dehydrogenase
MAQHMTISPAVQALQTTIHGAVHRPGDSTYDAARLPWNRRLDPHPAIVVEAAGPADVRTCILVAREHGLPFAVQSTGHGTYIPSDGGLLLRTGRMTSVEIDPERRTATVGAGVVWSDVNAAAAPYGLAPLSGTPAVGVIGYTLGGGTGWLSRTYGYAADSVVRAELVTAEGDLVIASADENPDLFWGLRGGSGNFGVVTSLTFRLYPIRQVYAGVSFYPVERAGETLTRYADWAIDEPDELNTAVMLVRLPASPQLPDFLRDRQVLAIRAFYAGEASAAERELDILHDAAGQPLMAGFRSQTFVDAATALGGPPPAPMAARQDIELFHRLPADALNTLLEATDGLSPLTAVEIRHWGGAIARPRVDAGPVGHRDAAFSVISTAILNQASDPDAAEEKLDDLAAALRPFATGGKFLNFLSDPAQAAAAYTDADHRRLAVVKQEWDPGNFFHLNHNIAPH